MPFPDRGKLLRGAFFFLLNPALWGLTLGAVQWEVSPQRYSNKEYFENAALYWMDQLGPADFIMFPEYTSAFTALWFADEINLSSLMDASAEVRRYLDQFWGGQAKERGIWILAGTYLEADKDRLYNTALVYGPDGNVYYSQRKSFLGDPEKEFGLSAGDYSQAAEFTIKEIVFALTICRDTYHTLWEDYFTKADLWIDIKGNELPFSREYYNEALPARLKNSAIPYGFTLSLTGDMIGYHFEGISQWILGDEILLESWTAEEETCLLFPMEN